MAVEKSYTFGVVPQQSAIKTAELWLPVLKHVSEATGITLVFRTSPSIPEFEAALARGDYDFAYMNPYHYVHFHEVSSYQAMAHARDRKIKGIVVARADSDIDELSDLQGEEIGFPSPAAFAASILVRTILKNEGIAFTPKYVNSHDSVYLNVYYGSLKAGGGVIRTFNNLDAKYRDSLKVIWTSRDYTPHAIAYQSRVPESVVQLIQSSLLSLGNDEAGKKLLARLKVPAWQSANDAEWDDVRLLDIHLLGE